MKGKEVLGRNPLESHLTPMPVPSQPVLCALSSSSRYPNCLPSLCQLPRSLASYESEYCVKYWGSKRRTQEDKTMSSPLTSSTLAGVKILCMLCRIGLGWARFFWVIPSQTSAENAVLLSKCVGTAGYWYV